MGKQYVAIKDNVILKMFRTKGNEADIKKSCAYLKLDYDRIELVPTGAKTHSNMHSGEFEKGWKLKSLEKRIKDGYRTCPPHLKVKGDVITEKSLKEKIDDGVITLESYQYYDDTEKAIKIDEAKLPKPKALTQAELLSELSALVTRCKEIENLLKK